MSKVFVYFIKTMYMKIRHIYMYLKLDQCDVTSHKENHLYNMQINKGG